MWQNHTPEFLIMRGDDKPSIDGIYDSIEFSVPCVVYGKAVEKLADATWESASSVM